MGRLFILVMAAFIWVGCNKKAPEGRLPLYRSLCGFHMKTSTSSDLAQQYFDQGMALYYGFNHEVAIMSFQEAADIDSTFAMAWWGKAISAGPNINNPFMDSAAAHNAYLAAQQALKLADGAEEWEKGLIHAIVQRYAWPQPEDRKALDESYANAMRELWEKYPKNNEIGVLFADAMMNLRPWDLWTREGKPQPGTPEIVSTLEKILAREPKHPGACHFYIHTMEASPEPEKALAAARRLGAILPGAGHLVHMPSHIYVRLGMYDDVVRSNQKAILADTQWIRFGGFYTLYRAHNYHFLAYGAMFEGRKALAMQAANDMLEQMPLELVFEFPDFLDAYLAVPYHVMVRFGLWEEILAAPRPEPELTATTAFWRYARSVALSALGRVDEAQTEFDALKEAVVAIEATRLLGNNDVRTVMEIGLKIAEGELEYRKGNYQQAFALLREAVVKDDALKYDEPWGWMMPARHALGALLVEQGLFEEAEAVYQEDLRINRGNGWALKGLHECYIKQGNHKEAASIMTQFKKAWKRADVRIQSSCYCSRG
jgi:tetratricopeptide (TPR) repeat protein